MEAGKFPQQKKPAYSKGQAAGCHKGQGQGQLTVSKQSGQTLSFKSPFPENENAKQPHPLSLSLSLFFSKKGNSRAAVGNDYPNPQSTK